MTTNFAQTASAESVALSATLADTAPDAPTACRAWRAHDIVAHLAAGAKEHADLIEHRLSGEGERATRGFEEREAPFRALDHDTLMACLSDEAGRKQAAYQALASSEDPSIAFTGTRLTKEKSETHSRSEAALHRWDITGDDDTSQALLAQPDLVDHAVWVLTNMPVLNESAQVLSRRAGVAGSTPVTIVLRSDGQPDIALTLDPSAPRLELVAKAAHPDLVVTMRADHRPLVLWGRQPAGLNPCVEGDRDLLPMLRKVLWADAIPWPADGRP